MIETVLYGLLIGGVLLLFVGSLVILYGLLRSR